jgi:hypothetical protein
VGSQAFQIILKAHAKHRIATTAPLEPTVLVQPWKKLHITSESIHQAPDSLVKEDPGLRVNLDDGRGARGG